MKRVFSVLLVLLIIISCEKSDSPTGIVQDEPTVTDIEGNLYNTIRIGTQLWMAENLKVTQYRNGDPIPHITNNAEWCNMTTGAYCNLDNDEENASVSGRLYNGFVVIDARGIAPEGWHVPTEAEWQTLVDFCGGNSYAGDKLKEVGTDHWSVTQSTVNNESGFTAVPGGFRSFGNGWFYYGSDVGEYWTSTESEDGKLWWYQVVSGRNDVEKFSSGKPAGLSIRCLRD